MNVQLSISLLIGVASSKKLAGRIVDEALRNYSVRNEFKDNPNYTSRIDAGKDNTSAVVFDKRKDEGGER